MTYSILAYDATTGSLGSAVASRSIAVGGTVSYSRFGVGIVNTQHHAHLSTGQRVLDEMERGRPAQEALETVLGPAGDADRRQIIAAGIGSDLGAWTGPSCAGVKLHRVGEHCVAAGNMLASAAVVERMVDAYESAASTRSFGERLLDTLEAGEKAGGDRRGQQAAAVRVIPRPERPEAINLDLRVDDHPTPLRELRRLHEAFRREFRR